MKQVLNIALAALIACAAFAAVAAHADLSPGAWGPVVSFRDRVTPTHVPDRPMPDGGWWVTPIHATALADGRVLVSGWGRFDEQDCRVHRTRQNGVSWLLDPKTLSDGAAGTQYIAPINESALGLDDVLYCAGNVTLPDGKILMVGGARYVNLGDSTAYTAGPADPGQELEYGLPYFRVFDPASGKFTRYDFPPLGGPTDVSKAARPGDLPNWYQQGMMWYPTETRLPGGRVLVAGGYTRNCGLGDCFNRSLNIFDPAALSSGTSPWSLWVDQALIPENVAPKANPKDPDQYLPRNYDPGLKDYTHTFLLYQPISAEKGGGVERSVILMGSSAVLVEVSLDSAVASTSRAFTSGNLRPGGAAAWDSTAALVGTGEILVMGGGSNPALEGQRIDLFDPVTGKWRSKDTGITRHNASTTLLPDGTVLIVNGEPGDPGPDGRLPIGDRHQAQIYDPYTDELTSLPAWPDSNVRDRGYHNFSVLLKDGQIATGGGMVTLAQVGCERPDARLFNPSYRSSSRPVISGVSGGTVLSLGGALTVRYAGAPLRPRKPSASGEGIPSGVGRSGAVLMALGSETHSFDQNQRYVPLDFDVLGPGQIRIHGPSNSVVAPEGDYFLFLVDQNGAVSEGQHVKVLSAPAARPAREA